ncbi:MAG: FAD-dependent monooxygenase [Rhizobiaceae bacterium]|nr:FAD-dependent monooxygenase [Rhizobiaceae bacterium]
MRKLDIAIAGAGPAGLASALFLHRAGHRVTVFERFDAPKPLGSGLILQPTGLAVLARLGLRGKIEALGSRIERLYGADAKSGRTVLDVRYDALKDRSGRFETGLGVHRAALFGVLHHAVAEAGIAVETARPVGELETGTQARLVFEDGTRSAAFDLVIDATGARSRLRGHCRTPAEPRPLAYGAWWASLPWQEGFDAHALEQRYRHASVMIGVLPIGRMAPALEEGGGEPMAAFFWSLKPDLAETVKARGLAAWKDEVRGHWPAAAAHLDNIGSFDELTLARYGHHTLTLPAGNGIAFIGDSAHSTSPQLGQGANMALLDAAALVDAVEASADVEAALAAYCRMRRWHVRIFQMASRAFTPFYQSDSRALPFLRDTLVATVARVPPGPRLLAKLVSGTLVTPARR